MSAEFFFAWALVGMGLTAANAAAFAYFGGFVQGEWKVFFWLFAFFLAMALGSAIAKAGGVA